MITLILSAALVSLRAGTLTDALCSVWPRANYVQDVSASQRAMRIRRPRDLVDLYLQAFSRYPTSDTLSTLFARPAPLLPQPSFIETETEFREEYQY